jgi:hypothetical protein
VTTRIKGCPLAEWRQAWLAIDAVSRSKFNVYHPSFDAGKGA